MFAFLLAAGSLAFLSSCSDDDDDDDDDAPVEQQDYTLTQEDLDKVSISWGDFTGSEDFGQSSVGHDGGSPADETIRSVWANVEKDAEMPVGTIITKSTYAKDSAGNKGALKVQFAMVKRKDGYNDGKGGNWEYLMMPYNPDNVDLEKNPHGIIPEASDKDGTMEGQRNSPMCISCHTAAEGGDFSFISGK